MARTDPDADFGVPADDLLHQDFEYRTPTTAPGVTTISTEQLASMLEHDKPLVIDGEKVLARDCVASIKRWGAHDSFGQAFEERWRLSRVREGFGCDQGSDRPRTTGPDIVVAHVTPHAPVP